MEYGTSANFTCILFIKTYIIPKACVICKVVWNMDRSMITSVGGNITLELLRYIDINLCSPLQNYACISKQISICNMIGWWGTLINA
jgi:hypothetical protein